MSVKRTDNTKSFLAAQRVAIASAILAVAELGATFIQDATPVQTGNLKANIKSLGRVEYAGKNKLRTRITTPVDYAPHVEFGTKFMAPRAMFRKGIGNNIEVLKNTFEAIAKIT